MKYLLDVNALIAWEHRGSPHHSGLHTWLAEQGSRLMATCAHTELGFLRVSMQVFGYSRVQAMSALTDLKRQLGGFVTEAPSPKLPAWATTAARTSDAYLAQVASAKGLALATFDQGVPGVIRIR